MALSRLGDFIDLIDERNKNNVFSSKTVMGISVNKMLIPTKADLDKSNVENYKILRKGQFAYCLVTSRNGNRVSIVFNEIKDCIISAINPVFVVKNENVLNSEYLMMFFNRPEFDRYARFNSWGSARETFSWEDLCNTKIDLPPIEIQRKYVAIYKALKDNLKVYQSKLDDIKTVLDSSIENLKKEYPLAKIGPYLTVRDVRNRDNSIKNVKGVTVYKTFREPTSKVNKEELSNYKIVKPMDIAFVQTTHNEKVFAFALNDTNEQIVVSSVNEVFFTDTNYLLPEYLSLFFSRKEFDRYARFHSWGSARETFTMEDVKNVMIPIPNLTVQENFAKLRQSYIKRKQILDKLKEKINNICPILIRGAIREAKNGVA